MPLSDLHKKKRKKNLVIGLVILGWIALIWYITMIKIESAVQTGTSVESVISAPETGNGAE